MSKVVVLLIISIIITASAITSIYLVKEKNIQNKLGDLNSSVVTINITKENIVYYLEQQPFVNALPSNAMISLKLYNFNSGKREIEKSYVITKGDVKESTQDNYDLEIQIHSKYLQDLGRLGFCDTVKKAQDSGDLGIETKLSQISLAIKYKSMMKYKDCLGL
jgi:hypothetical protein